MVGRKALYAVSIVSILILVYFFFNAINKFWIDNLIAISLILFFTLNSKRLHVNWFILSLISLFLLMHNLGSFGIYAAPLNIDPFVGQYEWDKIIHLIYGLFAGVYAVHFFHQDNQEWNWDKVIVISLMVVMGLSAIHEIVEYLGALILGPGDGVLYFGAGDTLPGDAEWDMIYGFVGAFFSTIITAVFLGFKKIYKQKKN